MMDKAPEEQLRQDVRKIVEEQSSETITIGERAFTRVLYPNPGDVLFFVKSLDIEPYKVEIISGKFWGTHGLSNFWEWFRLDESGARVCKENGYGSFYKEGEVGTGKSTQPLNLKNAAERYTEIVENTELEYHPSPELKDEDFVKVHEYTSPTGVKFDVLINVPESSNDGQEKL